jgi:hypothetical protein
MKSFSKHSKLLSAALIAFAAMPPLGMSPWVDRPLHTTAAAAAIAARFSM